MTLNVTEMDSIMLPWLYRARSPILPKVEILLNNHSYKSSILPDCLLIDSASAYLQHSVYQKNSYVFKTSITIIFR